MKVLITPIGAYLGRLMNGISTIKPDVIYICIQKSSEKVNEMKQAYNRWHKYNVKSLKVLVKNLKVLYEEKNIKTIELDLDNYLSIFKLIAKLILSLDENTEIFIDITSTSYSFRVAALSLSIFFKNLKIIYVPPSKIRIPEDFNKERIKDRGLEPTIVPTPKIDFSEIQTGTLRDILIKINTAFKGKVPSVTDLLVELGLNNEKGNMIMIGKLLDKLERYGCITTKKEGRIKKIELTVMGSSIAEVLNKKE